MPEIELGEIEKRELVEFPFLFNIYPVGLLVPGEVSQDVERPDKASGPDVSVSEFSHIQVSCIGAQLAAFQGDFCHGHRVVGF